MPDLETAACQYWAHRRIPGSAKVADTDNSLGREGDGSSQGRKQRVAMLYKRFCQWFQRPVSGFSGETSQTENRRPLTTLTLSETADKNADNKIKANAL
ncbi:MAG: hypothetical protein ACJ796_14725 [Gemmatimonadaceae bacterium]